MFYSFYLLAFLLTNRSTVDSNIFFTYCITCIKLKNNNNDNNSNDNNNNNNNNNEHTCINQLQILSLHSGPVLRVDTCKIQYCK